MPIILMLSKDCALDPIIKEALPAGFLLQKIDLATKNSLSANSSQAGCPILVLVEINEKEDIAACATSLKQFGLPAIAIISNLNILHSVSQAGFVEYLPQPLVPEEIERRLRPFLKEFTIKSGQRYQYLGTMDADIQDRLTRQYIQNERWITIGRLIASVCHNITNRMQATRGALTLAVEEEDLSEDMRAYLYICQAETQRVNNLVEMLRCIYHADADQVVEINVAEFLNEINNLMTDAVANRDLVVELSLESELPIILGRAGQLQFALSGLLLNLIDLLSSENGGFIQISARKIGPTVQIEFFTELPKSKLPIGFLEHALGLPTIRQALLVEHGELGLILNDPGLSVWINLPIN